MTTNVVVNAHCASDKEVVVKITEPNVTDETIVLQDGETLERVVYGDRLITVKEVMKVG